MEGRIGDQLRKARQERKVNQIELARLANVGVNTIYRLERHLNADSIDAIERIADALGKKIVLVDKSEESL